MVARGAQGPVVEEEDEEEGEEEEEEEGQQGARAAVRRAMVEAEGAMAREGG